MYVNKVFDPIQSKTFIWDPNILDWVAWDGAVSGGAGGGDVNVTNWPASQTVDDGGSSLTVDGMVDIGLTTGFALRVDEASSTVTYVGEASPGSAEGSSVWRIKKIDTTSGLVITWAGGAASFNQQWSGRAGLSYS